MAIDTREVANMWLRSLQESWEAGDAEGALALFAATKEYYERPFKPGTTIEEYRKYWKDIDGLIDIVFEYEILAVEGNRCCAHWRNSFRLAPGEKPTLLDGVFVIDFNDRGECEVFRQWWFAQD